MRPLGDVARLADEWRRLEAEADSSFFTSWHWIGAAVELMSPPPLELRVAENGELVALGLLWADRSGRRLRLNLGDEPRFAAIFPEYNGLLARRGRELEAWSAALAALPQLGPFSALRVDGADPAIAQAAPPGWLVSLRDRKPRYEVDLAAARARQGGYLEGLSRNARQQLRRSLRAAERAGGLRLEVATSLAQALDWFVDLERLHTISWRRRGRPGAFAEPFFRTFNQRLIKSSFEPGHVELVRAQIGGTTVGYLYNFIYRRRVLYYQSGFDYERFANIRCGLVTHALNIERHMRAGALAYDLLAGEQRYKATLGRAAGELLWFVLLRATWQNRLTERLRKAKAWLGGARVRESASSFVA